MNQTTAIAQLRGLIDVTRLVHDEEDLTRLLGSLAATIGDSLGFGGVVVNLYRPASDDFEVVTVHGSDAARAALLGVRRPRETWGPLLDSRFLRCGAYLIPHGSFDWSAGAVRAFVPERQPGSGRDAWHPEDALLVPLLHSDGSLLGILSVDEPVTGRTPTDEELEVLTAVAAHAALAVQSAQERAEAARHRAALEQLLAVSAKVTATHDRQEVLHEVAAAIHGALGFGTVAIALLDDDAAGFHVAAAIGSELPLSPGDLGGLLDPCFDREGCFLVRGDAAPAPRAWSGHRLLVPLRGRDGAVFGVISVDDPADGLLPSRQLLQALRMLANQATTALVAAEDFEALRDAEQARRAVIEGAPLAILDLDLEGRVRRWNNAATEIFGWREDEVLGRFNPIVPEDCVEESRALLARVLGGESVRGLELARRCADGSSVDVKLFAAPLRDATGAVTGMTSLLEDVSSRKRRERALGESEALKSALLANAPDAVILFDPDGRVREFNPAAEETFGFVCAEAIGLEIEDLLVLEGMPVARLLGNRHELTGVRADGSRFPVEVAFSCVDGGGERLYTATLRDVTRRRRSERRLREMEAKYRTVVEGLPLVTFVNEIDDDVVTTYISPQIETLLGYPPSSWYERGFYMSVVHPDDRERVLAEAQRIRRNRSSFRSEYRMLAADGTVVSVLDETVVTCDDTGRPLFLQGYLLDLTDRLRAQEALERSEQLYRLVVENSHDTITLVDSEGLVRYASPAVQRMLGHEPREVVGRPLEDYIHPDDRADLRAYLESDPDAPTRARVRHVDERWLTMEGLASFVEFEGEQMTLIVARDVTHHDRLEGQLRQAQKLEAVGRLAGGVAHDFNNLLTAIGGFSDYLLKGLMKDDPLRNDALEIKRAADRAGELTQQLLAFGRQQVLQARILDPREVVRGVDGLLRRLIGEDIELVLALDEEVGAVKADRGQVEQVIVNLALNARDAMPGGGRLTISCLRAEHAVVLEVADTGVGLDEETRQRLFEPFFTTKAAGKGTGLGLATVHGIVEQSGGTIDVASEPGAGTTFRISLPLVDERPALVEVPAPAPEAERSSGSVLLVEDEDAVRTLARRILTAEGYTVLEAANGAEALELAALREGAIDLLVTDVVMPGMSGREVADALSAKRPELRVLYMSGYTEDTIVHHGLRDPGVVFLPKPFTPAALAAAAREALEGGQPLKAARVLVVEDDEQVRGLVRSALSNAGYAVVVAADADDALRIAEEDPEPVDLLLTDVFMPRMDGRELSGLIKARRPELRLLYMSGKSEEVLLERGVIATGGRFLRKPFTLVELEERVRNALAGAPTRLSA